MRTSLSIIIVVIHFLISPIVLTAAIDTQIIAYKKVGGTNESLALKRYGPSGQAEGTTLPTAIFFFGGGWNGGNIGHFEPQARHLAERGMVAICAQYRTRSSHEVPPNVCLMDAKSAIRYVRQNAEDLGIDPHRLAVGGGSAGGHLAAATTFCDGFNTVGEDTKISTRANALLLFNPVIDNGVNGYGHERVREFWEDFSPLHNISSPPPTLFLLGDNDNLIPVGTGVAFQKAIEDAGGRCDLHIYPTGQHGFFNRGRPAGNGKEYYEDCVQKMDDFLASLGFLTPVR
ncbi:MAG: alpha/beta hydrolase [Verrucomicrobiota bacterium]|nr:alpha/beta hydrolase [Verrucomicrobiota bacterium]